MSCSVLFTPRSWTVPYRPRVTVDCGFSTLFGLPPQSADALERWLETLHALSCDDWLAIARSGDAARKAVTNAVTRHQLQLTAWFTRDMVSTAASATTLIYGVAAMRRDRQQLAGARIHAEWAALAIATRSWLRARDYELLCRPFNAVLSFKDSTTRVHPQAAPSVVEGRRSRFQAHGD